MTAPRSERGQSTVELALCLPFVLLLITAAVETTSLAVDNIKLWHATREAARVAAVEPDAELARAAALRVIAPLHVEVIPEPHTRVRGEAVVVETLYRPDAAVPLLGGLFERLRLRARATMRIEVP